MTFYERGNLDIPLLPPKMKK